MLEKYNKRKEDFKFKFNLKTFNKYWWKKTIKVVEKQKKQTIISNFLLN
jgi:hypothetical protein